MITLTDSKIEPLLKNPPLIPPRCFYIPQICYKSPQFILFAFFLSHLSTRRSARARREKRRCQKIPLPFPLSISCPEREFFPCFFTGEEKSESV